MGKQDAQIILNKACDIIADNLGSTTAQTYRNFFEGDTSEEVITSLQTLMNGLVGNGNAKKQLKELVSTYQGGRHA